jgi:hypothetical protein
MMTDIKSGSPSNWSTALFLLFLCSALILPGTLPAQTSQTPAPSAVIMVEIQCKPGTADLWRQSFEKETLPAIREAIQNGDAFTNFTFLEAPLPAQDFDFVLLFELKSFAALDTRRLPPHYEVLLRRLGPERFAALEKETQNWEKTVRVSVMRSYKVK